MNSNNQQNSNEVGWLTLLYQGVEYCFETLTTLCASIFLLTLAVFLVAELFVGVAVPTVYSILLMAGAVLSVGLKKLYNYDFNRVDSNNT